MPATFYIHPINDGPGAAVVGGPEPKAHLRILSEDHQCVPRRYRTRVSNWGALQGLQSEGGARAGTGEHPLRMYNLGQRTKLGPLLVELGKDLQRESLYRHRCP